MSSHCTCVHIYEKKKNCNTLNNDADFDLSIICAWLLSTANSPPYFETTVHVLISLCDHLL